MDKKYYETELELFYSLDEDFKIPDEHLEEMYKRYKNTLKDKLSSSEIATLFHHMPHYRLIISIYTHTEDMADRYYIIAYLYNVHGLGLTKNKG